MIPILISLAIAGQPPTTKGELPDIEELECAMAQMPAKRDYKTRMTIAGAVLEAGAKYDVDPVWLLAVAYAESRWNVHIKPGDKGKSFGIFQIQKPTAKVVKYAGFREDTLIRPRSEKPEDLLEDPWTASYIAAALWQRLRRKYKKRADIIYNCGFRCKGMKNTPATRAYWRYYRKLKRALKKQSQVFSCCTSPMVAQ